tara:strand:- start:1729 stop:2499 length:771 start_codon:yes stop_codon:yes gene_type:complete
MYVKYKSIFISDIHLGTRGCQADALCNFLKENTCDNLFLVGDILDGWRLKNRWYFPQSHLNVIRRILTAAKRDTNVVYILGNHDEFLRRFLPFGISFGAIKIVNQIDYHAVKGGRYLIIHGDKFDKMMLPKNKWLMFVGDNLYNFMIGLNTRLNSIRKFLGMKPWSLSKYLKQRTKQALNFIYKFEELLALHCYQKDYNGVICGHIHTPANKKIQGVHYINCGDWVESCTAVVETYDGTFEIINYIDSKHTEKPSA